MCIVFYHSKLNSPTEDKQAEPLPQPFPAPPSGLSCLATAIQNLHFSISNTDQFYAWNLPYAIYRISFFLVTQDYKEMQITEYEQNKKLYVEYKEAYLKQVKCEI